MEITYVTISEKNKYEYEEKKSVFTARIAPVSTEAEAISFVNCVKNEFPDARHNVYAYKLRNNGCEVKRYSDDGEPKGTAGMPVLEAIEQSGLTDVAVVVTRYFGGILLGASGLTRAYANTAGGAINTSARKTMTYSKELRLTFEYTLFGKISKFIENNNIMQKAPEFGAQVSLNVIIPVNEVEDFIKNINDLTSAACDIVPVADGFYEIVNKN